MVHGIPEGWGATRVLNEQGQGTALSTTTLTSQPTTTVAEDDGVIVMPQGPLWWLKRGIDFTVALVGLVVLSPFMALIALAISIDSPGPAVYRQVRVGRCGKRFAMCKFRTMVKDATERREELAPLNETAGIFKLRNDPRVTRVGRRLRRASLDELPQLLNVLLGQMSLVGPRPLIPEEDQLIEDPYAARRCIRPGMTGPWQALGPVRPPLREMVVIDCLYVESWSLRDDCRILLRTFGHVLRLHGV